ncbi:hypothetical protein ACGFZJ_35095 [Streptomyces sp. NPDC048253]|uniref:hypothetical protein n=1 Tax=Streptomyces sp. NPDC048253 TaxID=3365524 RepID=UPI003718ECB5
MTLLWLMPGPWSGHGPAAYSVPLVDASQGRQPLAGTQAVRRPAPLGLEQLIRGAVAVAPVQRDDPGSVGAVVGGELADEDCTGGQAVGRGPADVDADADRPALEERRHEGLPLVVLDGVDLDVP